MTPEFARTIQFAHRANIERYRKLLRTDLTDEERKFLETRLAEEQATLRQMTAGPSVDAA